MAEMTPAYWRRMNDAQLVDDARNGRPFDPWRYAYDGRTPGQMHAVYEAAARAWQDASADRTYIKLTTAAPGVLANGDTVTFTPDTVTVTYAGDSAPAAKPEVSGGSYARGSATWPGVRGQRADRVVIDKPFAIRGDFKFDITEADAAQLRDAITSLAEQGQDSMRRNEFTFAFRGREIAAAIDRKLADIDRRETLLDLVDLDAIHEAYGVNYAEFGHVLDSKRAAVRREIEAGRAKWQQERVGYAHAANKRFELDADDVAHYGLVLEDAA